MAEVKRESGTEKTPGLSTAMFAGLFDGAMYALGVSNDWLAGEMGRHPSTISHWRSPTYNPNPPAYHIRREIERHVGLPEFYLDGTVEFDLTSAALGRRGGPRRAPPAWEEEPYEDWMESSEAENRVDYLLHGPERLMRLLSNPTLFSRDFVQVTQLNILTGIEYIHQQRGVPVYPWLTLRRQQIVNGTYR